MRLQKATFNEAYKRRPKSKNQHGIACYNLILEFIESDLGCALVIDDKHEFLNNEDMRRCICYQLTTRHITGVTCYLNNGQVFLER